MAKSRNRKSKYDDLTQEEIDYQVTYRTNRWAYHLAGIVPLTAPKSDFNMDWSDYLMPVSPNYTAVERAVVELAFAGAKTIWLVCNSDVIPLLKYRLGEWIRDPLWRWRPKWSMDEVRIPIYYVQVDPRDFKSKRNTCMWSVFYGASMSYWISRKISRWITPDRYYVSFPQGVYPAWTPRRFRKQLVGKKDFYFSCDGKTIKDDEYLGFTFSVNELGEYKNRLDANISNASNKSLWDILPNELKNQASFYGINDLFDAKKEINGNIEEIPWYYNIEDWEGYCNYLGSEKSKEIQRPRGTEIIKPFSKWSLLGEERAAIVNRQYEIYHEENEP